VTPPETDLNPVSVLVLVLTAWLGKEFAAVAGAYTIILFGWFGGCIVGTLRMPPGRVRLAAFVTASFVITMGLTVPLAELLAANMPDMMGISSKALLFPVAALLPAIGHSWIDIGLWVAGLVRRRVERREETPR